MFFESLDNAGEIDQRSTQPVNLVDDHAFDSAVANVIQEMFKGGPIQATTAKATIVITLRKGNKPFAALAGDKGLRGLALRIERVELLIQTLVCGFAGIDGTTDSTTSDSREGVNLSIARDSKSGSPLGWDYAYGPMMALVVRAIQPFVG